MEESLKKLTSEEALQKLSELGNQFREAMAEVEKESEAYWNGLSKEDQLKAFCAVSRRIHRAEIVDQGTYRWALYDVFGFGPEAYAPAQLAGYLDIHNSICTLDELKQFLLAFCDKHGIEDADTKIRDMFL